MELTSYRFAATLTQFQEEDVLASGIKNTELPVEVLHQVVLIKQARHETRYLWVMAFVWELKEVKHYSKFLKYVIHHNENSPQQYKATVTDTGSLVKPLAFKHHAYMEDYMALVRSDQQLDIIKAAMEFHTAAA